MNELGMFFAFFSAVFSFILIVCIISYVINSVALMRIFEKAYVEKWKAWVPFVNTWFFFEIVGFPGWMVLLSFVPFVNFAIVVVSFIANYRLPICFGKSSGWGVLSIFFPTIVRLILAFTDAEFEGGYSTERC